MSRAGVGMGETPRGRKLPHSHPRRRRFHGVCGTSNVQDFLRKPPTAAYVRKSARAPLLRYYGTPPKGGGARLPPQTPHVGRPVGLKALLRVIFCARTCREWSLPPGEHICARHFLRQDLPGVVPAPNKHNFARQGLHVGRAPHSMWQVAEAAYWAACRQRGEAVGPRLIPSLPSILGLSPFVAPQAYKKKKERKKRRASRAPRARRTVSVQSGVGESQLLNIIYISMKSDHHLLTSAELTELGQRASAKNAQRGVTGFLLYTNPYFLQYLEGPPAEVKAVFAAIHGDPRHHNVTIVMSRLVHHGARRWRRERGGPERSGNAGRDETG